MKTHKVIGLNDDEQICFVGSELECNRFILEQNAHGLQIIPLTIEEFYHYNNTDNSSSYKKNRKN